jgi:hypothetical protein
LTPTGEKRTADSFQCENLKEGDSLEDLDIGKGGIKKIVLRERR